MYVAPFEPDRFEDAVPYYQKHRVRYADRLIARIAAEASLNSSSRVLDLGCGPGFIANAIAPCTGEVIGIDPNESMLTAARKEAAAAGVANVTYQVGSSFDLSIVEGPFQLVTMGRSFHWMDRVATLESLEGLVAQNGVIALLSDHEPKAPENAWWTTFQSLRKAFRHEDEFGKVQRSSQWEPHISILMRSAFSDLMHIGFYAHATWTVDDLIGLALSQSSTTIRRLGEKKSAFETAVREALEPVAVDGRLTALIEHSATLARRSRT